MSELDLEPRPWDDICPPLETDDGWAVSQSYLNMGGFRSYDGTVYVRIEDGWVPMADLHAALTQLLGEESEATEQQHDRSDHEPNDVYHCPECGFEWGGYNRPPPYAHCPECKDGMMRRGAYTD